MGSMGELIARRTLEKDGDRYVPGQPATRILDPYPHRDRADLAAILTYVDDEGALVDVMCFRYRDDRGWKAIKLGRYGVRKAIGRTHTAAALDYNLSGEHLALLEAASAGWEPFAYEEPPEDEQRIRRIANALVDRIERPESES